ncbi:DNA sulfur modification protein DndB [Lolliginicoccus suaedae]|uniref:DNA sulfur modification protein DndB n=1 Tax=Lolliginicoccus suaedae TaxID=2605429 RepID=UPI0016595032|nr:DNA sulfur modification protein DndB [Lolliginicoccus suaedae]
MSGVTRIKRPGIGYVYRAIIPIHDLYEQLRRSVVRYAPRYQRGFKSRFAGEMKDSDYDVLLPITDPTLQIDPKRAAAMAVKYLMAYNDEDDKHLFNADVIWNARIEGAGDQEDSVTYDEKGQLLTVHSVITVPDSGHRHFAYYLLGDWFHHPEKIPKSVDVDGDLIEGDRIRDWVERLNLRNKNEHQVYCDIYSIDAVKEGWLFDEFNADSKKPSAAVELDMNWAKDPERRFIKKLMDESSIFERDQLEVRSTSIAEQSQKLTTTSTLVRAINPYRKKLSDLEKNDAASYQDLVDFFNAFYEEWSNHFEVFKPNAKGRIESRKTSLATANIIYFPMFRLIIEMWDRFRGEKKRWNDEESKKTWTKAIAKLAGNTTASDGWKGAVMDRANTDWQGRIFIETFDAKTGEPKGWSLSSTRQTRDAAYHYLNKIIGLPTDDSQ